MHVSTPEACPFLFALWALGCMEHDLSLEYLSSTTVVGVRLIGDKLASLQKMTRAHQHFLPFDRLKFEAFFFSSLKC
jgi:hypothetical protein